VSIAWESVCLLLILCPSHTSNSIMVVGRFEHIFKRHVNERKGQRERKGMNPGSSLFEEGRICIDAAGSIAHHTYQPRLQCVHVGDTITLRESRTISREQRHATKGKQLCLPNCCAE
jgi:hypothetical protein